MRMCSSVKPQAVRLVSHRASAPGLILDFEVAGSRTTQYNCYNNFRNRSQDPLDDG